MTRDEEKDYSGIVFLLIFDLCEVWSLVRYGSADDPADLLLRVLIVVFLSAILVWWAVTEWSRSRSPSRRRR